MGLKSYLLYVLSYPLNLLLTNPSPAKPLPRRRKVEGSGTEDTSKDTLYAPEWLSAKMPSFSPKNRKRSPANVGAIKLIDDPIKKDGLLPASTGFMELDWELQIPINE